MIDWPPDDNDEDRLPALGTMLAELASSDAPRRRELLAAISDLSWKIGPNAAAAIPALIDWPLGGDRETEDEVAHEGRRQLDGNGEVALQPPQRPCVRLLLNVD